MIRLNEETIQVSIEWLKEKGDEDCYDSKPFRAKIIIDRVARVYIVREEEDNNIKVIAIKDAISKVEWEALLLYIKEFGMFHKIKKLNVSYYVFYKLFGKKVLIDYRRRESGYEVINHKKIIREKDKLETSLEADPELKILIDVVREMKERLYKKDKERVVKRFKDILRQDIDFLIENCMGFILNNEIDEEDNSKIHEIIDYNLKVLLKEKAEQFIDTKGFNRDFPDMTHLNYITEFLNA